MNTRRRGAKMSSVRVPADDLRERQRADESTAISQHCSRTRTAQDFARAGERFRVEYPVPGLPRRRADIAFTRAKVAVFVDGCFWHSCPEHATRPTNNAGWWMAKLEANRRRDKHTDGAS